MSLYNCCFTCLPKLFQVVYVHETRKNVGDWLRLHVVYASLGFVGLGGESSLEALQIQERIMRLHQRQSLHGTRCSGTLQPHRYFTRHQLQALLPIARRLGLHALREDLLQDKIGCSAQLISLGLQEMDLLQIVIPLPLGSFTDSCATSNQHTGKTQQEAQGKRNTI